MSTRPSFSQIRSNRNPVFRQKAPLAGGQKSTVGAESSPCCRGDARLEPRADTSGCNMATVLALGQGQTHVDPALLLSSGRKSLTRPDLTTVLITRDTTYFSRYFPMGTSTAIFLSHSPHKQTVTEYVV